MEIRALDPQEPNMALPNIVLVDKNEEALHALPIYMTKEILLAVGSTDFVRYVDLKFATYQKLLSGSAVVTFKIGGFEKTFKINLSEVRDNAYITFDLEEHFQANLINISISTVYKKPNYMAIWYSSSSVTYKLSKQEGYEAKVKDKLLLSILTGVYNPDPSFLEKAAASVFAQSYENWEWVLVDDKSTDPKVLEVLHALVKRDSRIKVIWSASNGGISASQNKALANASGDWMLVLDHDDTLHRDALSAIVIETQKNPKLDLIYSDEDKINNNESYSSPFYKPDWSPALLLSQNYVCHLCAYKMSEVRKRCPEGYRKEYDGSQDYQFLIEFTNGGAEVAHISRVLYHWRIHAGSTSSGHLVKPTASIAAKKAIKKYLSAFSPIESCEVLSTEYAGVYRPFVTLKKEPWVNIVIPTKDHPDLIINTLDSLLKTDYEYFGITLVDNGSDLTVMQPIYDKYEKLFMDQGGRDFNLVYEKAPFNFSAQINKGSTFIRSAKYLLLLNNDIEILHTSWLKELVWPMEVFQDVGAVGARLLYPNGTLQHAGVLMGVGGIAGHCHKHLPLGNAGYFSRVMTIHEVSAVTGACLLVRRTVFNEVGGLCEQIPVAFNDVDFCLKIRKEGHRIIYQPWAELFHHESVSRGIDKGDDPVFQASIKTMKERWAAEIAYDPYFSQHFSRNSEIYVYQ